MVMRNGNGKDVKKPASPEKAKKLKGRELSSPERMPAADTVARIKELQDPDWNVRAEAAEALGKTGDESAVPALIEALRDEDWIIRMKAAEALGKIGDPAAAPALREALNDSQALVTTVASAALADIDDKKSR